jgi:hypothetical protein
LRSGGAGFLSLLRRSGRNTHIIRGFARLKSEGLIFDILHPSKEDEEEEWPGEKVEDAVEDHFAGYTDDVPTFRETPANGVK